MDYYAIVHNDFDGTASAAVYARAVGSLPKKVFFTEPTKIHNLLKNLELRGVYKVMIADIGLNASTLDSVIENLKKLMSQGAEIEWFDHHVWKDEWKKKLQDVGIKVYHDTSTCGAGVVNKNMNPEDEFSKKLASADCSVDIWLHDDPMGEKLRRVVEYNKDYKWKEYLIQKFYKGILWDEEFERILLEQVDKELKGYENLHKYVKVLDVGGKKIVVAVRWRGPPDISYASQFLMNRYGAIVYASVNGKAISFRSNSIDVRKFAEKLGGGGHVLAAGAGLKAPFWRFLLNRLGIRSPMLNWASKIVEKVISETGFTPYEGKRNVTM
ncbi:DHH family phosphoesterase [Stygiolobus caldivivus]|uniref:Phosphoesterase n=1 Tax=Stygiolobus caldivivus TaxID=2824673 RepID=A0A8D5ZIB2_9CREN|nr:DHHA1 domain-containing protein [Stygiolobus caldivivus]BCU70454.1 phosphoesterase [Stygiolobus caldivivus]